LRLAARRAGWRLSTDGRCLKKKQERPSAPAAGEVRRGGVGGEGSRPQGAVRVGKDQGRREVAGLRAAAHREEGRRLREGGAVRVRRSVVYIY